MENNRYISIPVLIAQIKRIYRVEIISGGRRLTAVGMLGNLSP